MRAPKYMFVLITIGHLLTQPAFAQDGGALVKTPLGASKVSSTATLPGGILAGELDARIWLEPYNGLYFSKDLGDTWAQVGLESRGITDIEYSEGLVLVTTYYQHAGEKGLFISRNLGETFEHAGLNFSSSQVEYSDGTIYLGGNSHGLWTSKDGGSTWEQMVGDGSGWTGPTITALEASGQVAMVATPTKVFISKDAGETWTEIEQLSGKQISNFLLTEKRLYVATRNSDGIYFSDDAGSSWLTMPFWENKPVAQLYEFKKKLFAQSLDTHEIFVSRDGGLSWEAHSNELKERIEDSTLVFSYPASIFLAVKDFGLFQQTILPEEKVLHQFLDIPWHYEKQTELVDRITAYFDHEFPLQYYDYKEEPQNTSETTLNFLGQKEETPLLYYSGHDGVDFYLDYGADVLAPASGVLSYFYCHSCGHGLKIDHQNGYQTLYMHLQRQGLLTSNPNDRISVEKGNKIGQVGITGNSSGPHLHFGVMHDQNLNGIFDDFPDGMVDPFGWNNPYNLDPWPILEWQDLTGEHVGSKSAYLWNIDNNPTIEYFSNSGDIENSNKKITINDEVLSENAYTAVLMDFIRPNIPIEQFELDYVENTSFTLSLLDHYDRTLTDIDGVLTIQIDLQDVSLENVIADTISVYFWDPISEKWEALTSTYDDMNKIIEAHTSHLSHFAVLGEKRSYVEIDDATFSIN